MITGIELENFRRFERVELSLDDDAQLLFIGGRNGVGKCVPATAAVHDPDRGQRVTIEQFVSERRPRTLGATRGADGRYTVCPVDVSDHHDVGERDTVTVELSDGSRTTVAATHPLLTPAGCVPAADLTPGTALLTAARLPSTAAPLTPDEAYLYGLLSPAHGRKGLEHTRPQARQRALEVLAAVLPGVADRADPRTLRLDGDPSALAQLSTVRPSPHLLGGGDTPFEAWVSALSDDAPDPQSERWRLLCRARPLEALRWWRRHHAPGVLGVDADSLPVLSGESAAALVDGLLHAREVPRGGATAVEVRDHDDASRVSAAFLAAGHRMARVCEDGAPLLVSYGTPANGDLAAVTVRSIHPAGRQRCYDLTVDTPEHLYLVDEVVGHNSSLLEGIMYGLYGQGRSNLDAMVRHGCRLEGMRAAIDFCVDGTDYRVERQRRDGTSQAVLRANGEQLVKGPRQVTDQVAELFGMDYAGFKVAVAATQDEVQGLAKLDPSERWKMLTRLLRLDALTAAKAKSRERLREHKRDLTSLGETPDTDTLTTARDDAAKELAELQEGAAQTEQRIAELAGEVTSLAEVEAQYQRALAEQQQARGQLEHAQRTHSRLSDELERLTIPEVTTEETRAVDTIRAEQAEVAASLREAEARRELHDHLLTVAAEREREQEALTQVDQRLASLRSDEELDRRADELTSDRVRLLDAVRETERHLEGLRAEEAARQSERERLRTRISEIEELGPTCATCGQDVPEDHAGKMLSDLREKVEELDAGQVTAEERRRNLEQELQRHTAAVEAADQELNALSRERAELATLTSERSQLCERIRARDDQLARAPQQPPADPADLERRAGELAAELAQAQRRAQELERAAEAERRRDQLRADLATAAEEVAAAERLVATTGPDEETERQHQRHQDLERQVAVEREALSEAKVAIAEARGRLQNAERDLAQGQQLVERRGRLERAALVTSTASDLLDSVHVELSGQVRPALQASLQDLLIRMSDGRFDDVHLTDDFDLRLSEGGVMQPLSEFSGGEVKFVALAFRLALASVLSELNGNVGSGFLILDEVFESQDRGRRQEVLGALRELRGRYQQIFLISHVEGIEESADKVIEVRTDADREHTELEVL